MGTGMGMHFIVHSSTYPAYDVWRHNRFELMFLQAVQSSSTGFLSRIMRMLLIPTQG